MAIKNQGGVRLLSLVSLTTLALACGTAEFRGGAPASNPQNTDSTSRQEPIDNQSPPPTIGTVTPDPTSDPLALSWNVDCSDASEAKQASPFSIQAKNGADAEFKIGKFDMGTLMAQGKICPPKPRVRRVIFVVDVSESMVTNDPAVAGSNRCARLNAIESVIGTFPQDGSVKFAVVTFDQYIEFSSGQFVASLDAMKTLIDGMRPRRNWENTVCARLDDTRFDVALGEAKRLFDGEKTDGQSSQEVYLITDGEPDPGNTDPREFERAKGLPQAKALIDNKASIATVMLGGTSDQYLKLLSSNLKLHRVATDAKLLEKQLQELSTNFYLNAKLRLTFNGAVGGDDDAPANNAENSSNGHFEFNLLNLLNSAGEFTLPPVILRKDLLVGHGIIMQLRMLDRFGQRTKIDGKLRVVEE